MNRRKHVTLKVVHIVNYPKMLTIKFTLGIVFQKQNTTLMYLIDYTVVEFEH